MPIVQSSMISAPGIGRGLNAFSLVELVKRRIPGFQDWEYMSEVNAAYNEVWEELMQLDELFFSDFQTVTTTGSASDTFDLVTNIYGNLNNRVERIHQISRIRIQLPSTGNMVPADPRDINDPIFLAQAQQQPVVSYSAGPFYYATFGENSVRFSRPLPTGSLIEVAFTYSMIDLAMSSVGLLSNTALVVTGTNTQFTSLVPPEMTLALPNVTTPSESQIGLELVVQGKVYRVTEVTSDTAAKTVTAITPTAASSQFILASVPELPPYGHRAISVVATRNFLTTPAEDDRFQEWAILAAAEIQRMKNTFIQRQRQANPTRRRFPFGAGRVGGSDPKV